MRSIPCQVLRVLFHGISRRYLVFDPFTSALVCTRRGGRPRPPNPRRGRLGLHVHFQYRTSAALKKLNPQWRQAQRKRIRSPVSRNSLSFFAAQISNPTAAIVCGVAVEEFAPEAVERNTDSVAIARNRSEIANHQNCIFRALSFSQQRDHAGSGVIAIHPFKSGWIGFQFVERRFTAIETV